MTVNDFNPIVSAIESVGETLQTLSAEADCGAPALKRLARRLKTEIGILQEVLAVLECEP